MREQIQQVREFHEHMKITTDCDWPDKIDNVMHSFCVGLRQQSVLAKRFYDDTKDIRWLRLHLLTEELAEFGMAFATCDKLEVLDGIADLQYVLFGTASIYGLKLPEAFEEVHRSNMTKRPSDERCSDKTGYIPPNLDYLI